MSRNSGLSTTYGSPSTSSETNRQLLVVAAAGCSEPESCPHADRTSATAAATNGLPLTTVRRTTHATGSPAEPRAGSPVRRVAGAFAVQPLLPAFVEMLDFGTGQLRHVQLDLVADAE